MLHTKHRDLKRGDILVAIARFWFMALLMLVASCQSSNTGTRIRASKSDAEDATLSCLSAVLRDAMLESLPECQNLGAADRDALTELSAALPSIHEQRREAFRTEALARVRLADGEPMFALCIPGYLQAFSPPPYLDRAAVSAQADAALPADCGWVHENDFQTIGLTLASHYPAVYVAPHFLDVVDGQQGYYDANTGTLGVSVFFAAQSDANKRAIVEAWWASRSIESDVMSVLSADPTIHPVIADIMVIAYRDQLDLQNFDQYLDQTYDCRIQGQCCTMGILCDIAAAIALDIEIRVASLVVAVRGYVSPGDRELTFSERLAAALLVLSPSLGWANAHCSEAISVQCAADVLGASLDLMPIVASFISVGSRAVNAARFTIATHGVRVRAFVLDTPIDQLLRPAITHAAADAGDVLARPVLFWSASDYRLIGGRVAQAASEDLGVDVALRIRLFDGAQVPLGEGAVLTDAMTLADGIITVGAQGGRTLNVDVILLDVVNPFNPPRFFHTARGNMSLVYNMSGIVDEAAGRIFIQPTTIGLSLEHEFFHVQQTAAIWGQRLVANEADWFLLEAFAYQHTLDRAVAFGLNIPLDPIRAQMDEFVRLLNYLKGRS